MTCKTCNMTINSKLNVFAQQWNRAGETEEVEGETEQEEIHVGCVEGGGIERGTAGARIRQRKSLGVSYD